MFLLIVFLVLFLIITSTAVYFFFITFVRKDISAVDDLNSKENEFLKNYRPTIEKGINYINSRSGKWVYCKAFDGIKLAARYFDNNSKNTIILVHGYRSSSTRDFSCAVKMYSDFGLNVLLVDQRAHGKSEGKLITFGIKERRDVASWVEYIKNNHNCDKVLLGGMSMGATSVLLSSELVDENLVKGIIADCGFTSPPEILIKVGKQNFNINPKPFLPIMDLLCKILGKFSIYEVSTVDVLKKNSIPVIFIHGKVDNFVPCDMSQAGFDAAVCTKDIVLVEKAGHGMSFLIDEKLVLEKIKSFLEKVL